MLDRRYSTLLFDLDGTLIQYHEAQSYAVSRALEDMAAGGDKALVERVITLVEGEDVQDIEACRPGWEPAGSERMKNVFREFRIDLPAEEFLERYFTAMGDHGVPLRGVEEMLHEVSLDRKLGVVSNGLGPVQRKRLQKAGLMQYLDLLVLSCEAGFAKPDPSILRLAMKLSGSTPEDTLFIGDSTTSDMGAAGAAGMDFVYIDPSGEFTADGPRILEIQAAAELKEYLLPARKVDPTGNSF